MPEPGATAQPQHARSASTRPLIGVATTTPLAFFYEGKLYLERMSVLADDGAGVLSTTTPPIGTHLQVAFRLSTAAETVRCRAEVLAALPTTPNGVLLKAKVGERAFKAAMGSTIGDSATMIFRTEDLEKLKPKHQPPADLAPVAKREGFCIRFLDLDATGKALVHHHLETSRRLGEQLAARGGQRVSVGSDERATMSAMFDDDADLSKKAESW